jgi:hypothetical protein
MQEIMLTARQQALEQAIEDGLVPEDWAEKLEVDGGFGPGMRGGVGRGFGLGMHGRFGGEGFMHDTIMEVFAEALGLSVTDLEERLEAGETMWQIAEAEGLSAEELGELMSTARQEALEQAVEDGLIPEDRAEWMEENGFQHGFGGLGDCDGGFRHGRPGMGWNFESTP